MKHFKSFFVTLLSMGVGFALCTSTAFAQEEEAVDDGLLGQDVLGWIGLVPPKRPPIRYHERAPLVIPPGANKNLPPPVDRNSLKGRAANWPNDPDVAARERSRMESLLPRTKTENWDWQKGRPISPSKLRADRGRVTQDNNARSANAPDGSRAANYVDPRVLRNSGQKVDSLASGQEPERESLSDPPIGYRKPSGKLKTDPRERVVRVDESSPRAYYSRQ